MRVRDPNQAEDLVQETLLAALKARKNFAGQSTVKTWLVGILKHKIIDFFRKNSREKLVDPSDNSDVELNDFFDKNKQWLPNAVPNDFPNPTQAIENEEFTTALLSCLEKLPPRTAEAFSLREMEDMSSEEICNILDITPNNFWVMMHRARIALRKCLENSWLNQNK
ncbi:MAG: RNA polymerase subunit sigma [Ectothiorhodospiraceae bacterium]|nr:RNA polymerase subunit sigma [Ectothiorhodospiraceae bacterium]